MKSISDISSCVGWDISFARCNQHIHRADSINQLFAGVLLIKFLFQNSVNNKSSNPIVQMGMFMDADGIPLAFSVFDGNQNEQPSMSPLTGKEQSVTMLCENELAGVMLDRFGRDVKIRKVSETQFRITVDVAVSNNFFGWLVGLGNGVKIIAPDKVVEDMKQYIMQLYEIYDLY